MYLQILSQKNTHLIDLKLKILTVLVYFFLDIIYTLTESNLGMKGFISSSLYKPPSRKAMAEAQGKSLKQKASRNAAYWLAPLTCSAGFLFLFN